MFQNYTECLCKFYHDFWCQVGFKPSQRRIQHTMRFSNITYCWWKKSCTTLDVQDPVNNVINYQHHLVNRITSINSIARTIVELDWFLFLTITGLEEKNPTWYPKKVVFCLKKNSCWMFYWFPISKKTFRKKNTQKNKQHFFGTSALRIPEIRSQVPCHMQDRNQWSPSIHCPAAERSIPGDRGVNWFRNNWWPNGGFRK